MNNSKIVVSREENLSIVGTIRFLKWNHVDILPIEKLFNIKISDISSNKNIKIWYIGRFAIKKGVDRMGFNVLKTLMTCVVNEVCKSENSFALAECDVKLLKILNLLGIETIVLADSINYLGSETLPVILPYKGLKSFLDKNIHLLPPQFYISTPECSFSVVSKNYTLV
ncbi:hypothetical protein [Chryseobacterium sp. T1]